MKTTLTMMAVVLGIMAMTSNPGWSRGFGGGHGGMGGGMGGGMRGGMGGMNRGMGGMGGMNGMNRGMGGMGGMNGMNRGMGGMNGMNRGMGGMNGMNGMNRGMGGMNGMDRGMGGMNGMDRGMGDMGRGMAGGFPGAGRIGFGDAGRGAEGLGGVGARADRSQLGNFLGLPSDGGMHGVAGAAGMAGARTMGGEGVAARRGEDGFFGGGVARDGRGLARYDGADMAARGAFVRDDFRRGDFYSRGWYGRYPGAWFPRRWAYGDVWGAANWAMMSNWWGYGSGAGLYYDYGNNITYQDNSVYMNGQNLGTADEYYQQVQTQATAGTTEPDAGDTAEWMPLGVFAMSHDQQTKANLILQLAINKDGILRGNYTATLTNDTKPVKGTLDKKTQRVAFTIGSDTTKVFETGVYDFTKDEVPLLVHFGKDKTEQWQLTRLSDKDGSAKDAKDSGDSNAPAASGTAK